MGFWLAFFLLCSLQLPVAAQPSDAPDLLLRLQQSLTAEQVEAWQITEATQQKLQLRDTQTPGLIGSPRGCLQNSVIVLRTDSAISRPMAIPGCPAAGPLPIVLEPATEVTGSLTEAIGLATGKVHLVRCGETFRFGVVPALINGRRLTATVPLGCWDVTLRIGPATPVTWPQQQLTSETVLNLGKIDLQTGAALVARVVGDDGAPISGAILEVFPAEDFRQVAEQTYGADQREVGWPGRTDANGWVRLAGLPPGILRLRARSAAPELAPVFYGPFELTPETEVRLEDIILPQAAKISIGLESADAHLADCEFRLVGHLDPGCGWLNRTLVEARFQQDDTVGPLALAPGQWRFSVQCHHPQGTVFTVARDAVSVAPDSAEIYWLPSAGHMFHGRVLRGGEPVRAFLQLQPIDPEILNGERLPSTYSNREGAFVIGVPETGDYRAWFRTTEQVTPLLLDETLKLSSPDRELELHLPDGSLRGVVLDTDSRPVAGATVIARRLEAPGHHSLAGENTSTDGNPVDEGAGTGSSADDGTFQLRNLPAGTWALRAAAGDPSKPRISAEVRVVLAEEAEVTGIRLPLQETAWLHVQVLDTAGNPIPRATVSIRLEGAGLESLTTERTLQSNSAGAASAPIPAGTYRGYGLRVEALGYRPAAQLLDSLEAPISIVLHSN